MDLPTIIAVSGINVALIGWLRSDMRGFQSEIRSDMQMFQNEIRSWKEEMHKESKDFHGRLCAIEERQKKSEKK